MYIYMFTGKSFAFRQLVQFFSRPRSSGRGSGNASAPTAGSAALQAGMAVLEVFGNVHCEAQQNADSSRFGRYLRLAMQVP